MGKSFAARLNQSRRDRKVAVAQAELEARMSCVLNNKYYIGPCGRYGSVRCDANCEILTELGPKGTHVPCGVRVKDYTQPARFYASGGDQPRQQMPRMWKDCRHWDVETTSWSCKS